MVLQRGRPIARSPLSVPLTRSFGGWWDPTGFAQVKGLPLSKTSCFTESRELQNPLRSLVKVQSSNCRAYRVKQKSGNTRPYAKDRNRLGRSGFYEHALVVAIASASRVVLGPLSARWPPSLRQHLPRGSAAVNAAPPLAAATIPEPCRKPSVATLSQQGGVAQQSKRLRRHRLDCRTLVRIDPGGCSSGAMLVTLTSTADRVALALPSALGLTRADGVHSRGSCRNLVGLLGDRDDEPILLSQARAWSDLLDDIFAWPLSWQRSPLNAPSTCRVEPRRYLLVRARRNCYHTFATSVRRPWRQRWSVTSHDHSGGTALRRRSVAARALYSRRPRRPVQQLRRIGRCVVMPREGDK